MAAATRTGGTRRLPPQQLTSTRLGLSTQFSEGADGAAGRPSTSRHAPTHMPDRGDSPETTAGRSSELTSARVAGDPGLQELAQRVLGVYAARSVEEQRHLITEFYSEHAVYENPVALVRGRDAIAARFSLLPVITQRVQVDATGPAVELGAATSVPEALDNLGHCELQIEVTSNQLITFDRAHSLWRQLLLPRGDVRLSVLSRLTLRDGDHKCVYHRDMWLAGHEGDWSQPLKRCWGVVEQAAGSRLAQQQQQADGSGGGGSSPGSAEK